MTVDPLILAFLIESLILVIVVLLAVFWIWRRQQRRDHEAAMGLINRLKRAVSGHAGELAAVLDEIARQPEEERAEFIETCLTRERALYRHILELFLEQDCRLLPRVEQQVRALTEPYRELLRRLPGGNAAPEAAETGEELQRARAEIDRLQAEVDELARQLQIAMETIESLSSEYTRMFAPDRTGEELETSRRRILAALQASQQRLQGGHWNFDDEDIIIVEGGS